MLELSKLCVTLQNDNLRAYEWLSKAVNDRHGPPGVRAAAQVALALHLGNAR